jgi:hypothetical protein
MPQQLYDLTTFVLPRSQDDRAAFAAWFVEQIHAIYPKRHYPHRMVPVRTALMKLCRKGERPLDLLQAAKNYRRECDIQKVLPKYVHSSETFYKTPMWRGYVATTVHGLTRDEWITNGDDPDEWDALLTEVAS